MERACLEQGSQRVVILEKLLYCASSAIVSAIATFSITRFFQRRRQTSQQEVLVESRTTPDEVPKSEPIEEGKHTAEKPDVGDQERQFLLALARSKDLECQLAIAKEDKEAADDSCQDLEERLKEATESVKQLKHQLGKTKYQHKEMEDSFQALRDEKEAALNKIQTLKREIADAQKSENECKNSFSGLQRSLSSQLSDRKSAEKLARKLENELSEVHASKSRLDAHYRNSLQNLETKLRRAESDKQKAQDELSQHLSQVSSTRQKVQAIGVEHIRVQQDYQHSQDNLRELMLRHRTECQKHIETASHLRKANERIRELEKELRITREAARNKLMRTHSSNSFESNTTHQTSR